MNLRPLLPGVLLVVVVTGCAGEKKKRKHDDDSPSAPVSAGPASASPAPDEKPEDPFVERHLALLVKAGVCAKGSSISPFCAVTKLPVATPAAPPAGPTAIVGLSTFVPTEGATPESIAKQVSVSALAFQGGPQGKAWISSVKGDDEAELAELASVRAAIEGRLAGGPAPTLPLKLADYASKLPGNAKYPLAPHPRGFRLQGGSNADLRLIGETWVAVEVPARDPKGMWVNVFPR